MSYKKCDLRELQDVLNELESKNIKFITESYEPECGRFSYTIFYN